MQEHKQIWDQANLNYALMEGYTFCGWFSTYVQHSVVGYIENGWFKNYSGLHLHQQIKAYMSVYTHQ